MTTAGEMVIEVEDLVKVFRLGVRLKRVDALQGISLQVPRGAVFGFLGPNGAGKTTTMKILMGLIHATSGRARIFGQPVGTADVARRLGYLPEHPYFYDYLSGRETLHFYGRLFGLPRAEVRRRAGALLERVGLVGAADRAVRKYSKGMLQRIGIAQALLNDPELVVLDEPLSGLDPIGRKEVRDILLSEKRRGKTIFFSSHILADIEMICDRIAIVHEGRIREAGSVHDLLERAGDRVEILVRAGDDPPAAQLQPERMGEVWQYEVSAEDVGAVLEAALSAGAQVVRVTPRRATLEDLFMAEVRGDRSNERAA